jgi:hypothetical protein
MSRSLQINEAADLMNRFSYWQVIAGCAKQRLENFIGDIMN